MDGEVPGLAAAGRCRPVQAHSATGEGLDLVFGAYERMHARRSIRPLRTSSRP
ncbi:MAG: hypothetical protein ACRDN0_31990 [Trebonia sp.]